MPRLLCIRIDNSFNYRYISVVLRPVALPFIQALLNAMSQKDNARLHVVSIIRTFLYTENA